MLTTNFGPQIPPPATTNEKFKTPSESYPARLTQLSSPREPTSLIDSAVKMQ